METQFPKPLRYAISQLSGFSKTAVRLTPDKINDIKPNDTIRVTLPNNSLCDLSTLCFYYEFVGDTNCHHPRLSSSIIRNLSIYFNGNLVENFGNSYNILYNRLYDMDGGGSDQTAKRFLENADPSVFYDTGIASTSADTGVFRLASTTNATRRKFAITNWLGLISTLSTKIIDTNDVGKIELELTFAEGNICFQKQAQIQATGGYTIHDAHFMINRVVFSNPMYYNMKASKLLSSGLTLGYQTWICSKGALANKSSSFNVSTSVNSTSLDCLVGCFTPEDQTTSNLLLSTHWYSSASVLDTPKPFNNVLSLASIGTEGAGGINAGGYFNQSRYFRSDACGLTSSSWEINNVPLFPIPLADYEIYNESLIALGNNHENMGIGVHDGIRGLGLWLKYYFTHICSLEMLNTDLFTKSGVDGRSSALNIVWRTSFGANTSDKVVTYIFAKTTRIIQINEGHSISVIV